MSVLLTAEKFAFVELAKVYLGYTHIPGHASGFNPSPEDEVVCLDMVLSFPDDFIAEWNDGGVPRHLAHGVVNYFYWGDENIFRPDSEGQFGSSSDKPLSKRIVLWIMAWKNDSGN